MDRAKLVAIGITHVGQVHRPRAAFAQAGCIFNRFATMRILGLPGAVPIEGGLVLMQDGKLIGAIGVSGMASDQDGVVAKAGVDAIK